MPRTNSAKPDYLRLSQFCYGRDVYTSKPIKSGNGSNVYLDARGYVLSQALAIPTTLAPPVLNASLAVAETQSDRPQLAKNAPANLTVKHGSGE